MSNKIYIVSSYSDGALKTFQSLSLAETYQIELDTNELYFIEDTFIDEVELV